MAVIAFALSGVNLRAQGIFRTSFEEYPSESLVSYLDSGWGTYEGFFPIVAVKGGTIFNSPVPDPFQGSKLLYAPGGVVFRSPDGHPMQEVRFKAYVESQWAERDVYISIPKEEFGTWTDVVLSFQDPVLRYRFQADFSIGEIFALPLFVDNLQIVTVPEPGSVALAGLGVVGFAAARVRKKWKFKT